jgi:hypothetical protein
LTEPLRLLVGWLGASDTALALLLHRLHTHEAFPCDPGEWADGESFDGPTYKLRIEQRISDMLKPARTKKLSGIRHPKERSARV